MQIITTGATAAAANTVPALAFAAQPLKIGVSSCLVGHEVRHNGGHTRSKSMLETLGPWVDWVPVCPEVEIGLGVPRESLRLVGTVDEPRMVGTKSGTDHTEKLGTWAETRLKGLLKQRLDGYVFKKGSPSCGLFRVKVYDHNTVPASVGRGLFAAALTEAMPLLPVEEEGRLNDARLRENFIERLFAYQKWQELLEDPSLGALVQFQADFKMTLMAHSPAGQKELGRLVAEGNHRPLDELLDEYGRRFMAVMGKIAAAKGHTNVLHHLMGFLKQHIDADDKAELVDTIEQYRLERVPLIVPVTLLKHHIRKHEPAEWLSRQTYLNPYPAEMMLRNQI